MRFISKNWLPIVLLLLTALPVCGFINHTASAQSAATMAPYQEFIYQGNISIKYRELNQGHPYTMLFIHGFGAASHYWRDLEEHFAATYNTVALDLKGLRLFGQTQGRRTTASAIRPTWSRPSSRKKTCPTSFWWVIPWAGAVALLTHFKSKPGLVKGLILLDNASYGQELPEFVHLLRTPVLNTVGPALLPDKLMVKHMLQQVFYDQTKITEDMIRQYTTYLKTPGAYHALRETAKQIIPENVDEIIDQTVNLKIPVLIIWGENDQILPLSSGQRLHYDIKDSEFVIIPESGHNVHEEKPARNHPGHDRLSQPPAQGLPDFFTCFRTAWIRSRRAGSWAGTRTRKVCRRPLASMVRM